MSRLTVLSRLQSFLHCRVQLRNNHITKAFIKYQLVKLPPTNMEELYHDGPFINIFTASDALGLCLKIRSLIICFSYQHIQDYEVNPLLEPLEALRSLRSLYIELVTVVDLSVCYLSDYPIFH